MNNRLFYAQQPDTVGRCMNDNRRGSSLLLVLWAIAVLSMTIVAAALLVNARLEDTGRASGRFEARIQAESGLALALHPKVDRLDPLLIQVAPGNMGFRVKVTSEGSRLNLNTLLASKQTDTLERLFESWGVKDDEASRAVDCLVDWVDGDDLEKLNGAERMRYAALGKPELPRNRPFRSLAEVETVIGMDVVIAAKPDWKDTFTLWSDGKLDVNDAPPELIKAMGNLSDYQVQAISQAKLGPDGKADTEDDVRLTDFSALKRVLGMSDKDFTALSERLTADSQVLRIESEGLAGRWKRKLTVVARRTAAAPQILWWRET